MSMSVERLRLSLESSLGIAREGPMPIMRGGTPAMVEATYLARMGWERECARERRIRRMAAAVGFVSKYILGRGGRRVRTSVCDLAGVATGASVAVLREGRAKFIKGFKSGAVARSLIFD